ncbi:Cullin-4B [Dactylella cylindrospora]|nr:Cullin-4B [Dactylella cylindrospora]
MPDNGQPKAGQGSTSNIPSSSLDTRQTHKKRKPSVGASSNPNGDTTCKLSKPAFQSLPQVSTQDLTSDKSVNPAKRIRSGDSPLNLEPAASAAANLKGEMLASSPPQRGKNVVDLTTNSPGKASKPIFNQPSGIPPRNGAKRIVIKNLREKSTSNQDQWVQKTLDLLDRALTAVFEDAERTASKEEVYQGCQSLCRLKQEPKIHELLKRRCRDHVSNVLRDSILSQANQSDENLARIIVVAWNKWQQRLPRFIDVSESYYSVLADEQSDTLDVAQYARECASQIDREIARVERFNLETTTKRDLIAIIEKEMIVLHMVELLDQSGINKLIDKNDTDSLRILYAVIDRLDDYDAGMKLRPIWAKWIKDKGTAIVTDKDRDAEMVPRLLELKSSLDHILKVSFNNDEELAHALRESFETFINEQRKGAGYKNNSKPSEMIAKYMDLLLRSGIKAISASTGADGEETMGMGDEDVQLSHQLDQALDLFRFIHGKDVFEAFYKKDLARRLLLGRSASADAEKAMLSKLKTECGSGFTMNLEIMFKDIDISKENMASFKLSKSTYERTDDMDLHVTVLSQAAWPTYPETAVTMPQNVAQYMEAYHRYYTSKHKGRKLAWRHALAHCVLRADFPKQNTGLTMPFLADAELTRTLQSLACARLRPLTKHPKGKEVKLTDTFTVNHSFTDPKFRIKINQIQLKETKEENTATHEQITQDRQYETQAAIIRIMKSRKTINHNELITETINQTKKRGVLDMADIKKNIER